MKLFKRLKSREKMMLIVVGAVTVLALTFVLVEVLFNRDVKYIKLGEDITLTKNIKESITIDKEKFEIELISTQNNTCPKDAMCQVDYFEIKLRINTNDYSLGAGYGSKKPEVVNIKGTTYYVNLNSKYIKDKATITITSKNKEDDTASSEMAEVDNYIDEIINSKNYSLLSQEDKVQVIQTELDVLATTGTEKLGYPLIKKETIFFENNMYSFIYTCGALGKVTISDNSSKYSIDNEMDYYDSNYSKRGIYYDTLNEPNAPSFYTIAMGSQSSGGYNISIEEVKIDEDNNVEVIVKETKPSPDEMTTEAITYPICKLTLPKHPKSIIFKSNDEKEFENINF